MIRRIELFFGMPGEPASRRHSTPRIPRATGTVALRRACIMPFLILAFSCAAGQAVPHTNEQSPYRAGQGGIFKELTDEYENAHAGRGKICQKCDQPRALHTNPDFVCRPTEVALRRAKLCASCGQSLYKHNSNDFPEFECAPIDPKTGVARKTLAIKTKNTQCPVCQSSFVGTLPGNVNDNAGRDRDFCAHSVGKYNVHSRIWICPECGYAGLFEGFGSGLDGKPLDEPTKAFVKQKLSENMRKRMIDMVGLSPKKDAPIPEEMLHFSWVSQSDIPDWIKYDHALQIYEQIKPPRTFMAAIYLEAAHACRRQVYGEIAISGLYSSLQESLGKSIRRISACLQSECLTLRRDRGDAMADPTKAEVDPNILATAVDNLIRKGDEAGARLSQQDAGPGKDNGYLTTGDMYVLYLNYAGILDRLGRMDDADRALDSARSFIPKDFNRTADAAQENFFARQLKLLHGAVDDRQTCLRREREYLFNAARFNMAAIKFQDGHPGKLDSALEAAPTSYLLGELLRRAKEPANAAVWFNAAAALIDRELDKLEKSVNDDTQADKVAAQRVRWMLLKGWTLEQQALIIAPGSADEYVHSVVSQVLNAAGVDSITVLGPLIPGKNSITPDQPSALVIQKPNPAQTPVVASSPRNISREALYQEYYSALVQYRTEKKSNPSNLMELVKTGYISSEKACLDEHGKLVCPETSERLSYARSWEPGDKTAVVLFSIAHPTTTKALYADGVVRVGTEDKGR